MEAPLSQAPTENFSSPAIPKNVIPGQLVYEDYKLLSQPGKAGEAIVRAREMYFNRDRLLPF